MLEVDPLNATKNIGFHNGTWQIYVPRDFANSVPIHSGSRKLTNVPSSYISTYRYKIALR